MAAETQVQFFLGANAPTGFYSLYDQLIDPATAEDIFILKGGPGCGKSSLMRRVGRAMEEHGLAVEYILCSGDPDSLDAVVIPALNAAIVDGTAPHVVEPLCPGVVERYVNLGACYDRAALGPLREEIAGCMSGYKGCYARPAPHPVHRGQGCNTRPGHSLPGNPQERQRARPRGAALPGRCHLAGPDLRLRDRLCPVRTYL